MSGLPGEPQALVAVTVERDPHVKVLALWERPAGDAHWRVRDGDVIPVLRQLADEWNPVEIVCDIAFWREQLEALADDGYPVVQYPQTGEYMVPAATMFYEAVLGGHVSHDGDPRLARHLDNTTVKLTKAGARIAKESSMSNRKIDLATAAVMAVRRAKDLAGTSGGVGLVSASQLAEEMGPDEIRRLVAERDRFMEETLAAARGGRVDSGKELVGAGDASRGDGAPRQWTVR